VRWQTCSRKVAVNHHVFTQLSVAMIILCLPLFGENTRLD